MAIDLIIRSAKVVTPKGVAEHDIYVDGEKFVDAASSARQTIDATGLTAFPGLIDSHVHFNEPGRPEWEGIATGSSALAAGGGTCFFDMPLNSHPTLNGAAFDLKLRAAKASAVTDFGLWGGLTPINLDRMDELAERGVVGFKAFMSHSGIPDFEHADDLTLFRGMQIAAKHGLPVAVHAESDVITSKLTNEIRSRGGKSVDDYLASRPVVAEVEAIARAIILAEEAKCKLHIVHVSTSRGVELVSRSAGAKQCDVSCETCPHYLAMNEADMRRLGAAAKCAPPLRSMEESNRLWQYLKDGQIAFIASDHSPAPSSMKQGDDFFSIWGGVAGVQSTLAVLLSHQPGLTAEVISRVIAGNVASRYRLASKGQIAPGFDADLSLIDESAEYELTQKELLDRHKLSPYVGRRFTGKVRRTIVRGTTVFVDGQIVSSPLGQLVRPEVA